MQEGRSALCKGRQRDVNARRRSSPSSYSVGLWVADSGTDPRGRVGLWAVVPMWFGGRGGAGRGAHARRYVQGRWARRTAFGSRRRRLAWARVARVARGRGGASCQAQSAADAAAGLWKCGRRWSWRCRRVCSMPRRQGESCLGVVEVAAEVTAEVAAEVAAAAARRVQRLGPSPETTRGASGPSPDPSKLSTKRWTESGQGSESLQLVAVERHQGLRVGYGAQRGGGRGGGDGGGGSDEGSAGTYCQLWRGLPLRWGVWRELWL